MNQQNAYLMEDEREAERLATKVDAVAWVHRYLGSTLSDGMMILDVGCGPGVIAQAVAALIPAGTVIGIDAGIARLTYARASHADTCNLQFIEGTASHLPFPDNSFDVVCCRFVLEYLPDRQEAVDEMVRVLKPGGMLLLQDLDGQFMWHYPPVPALQERLDRVMAAISESGFDPFVGRKLHHMACTAGIHTPASQVEGYHVVAGTIDDLKYDHWRLKLDLALPIAASALGSMREAEYLKNAFLDYLRSPETFTYSVLITITGKKP